MTDIVDYYRLLGIKRTSTEEEIKKAYRRLVELYHPDKIIEVSKEFREQYLEVMILLNQAKDILLNKEKRMEYNKLLEGKETIDGIIVGESREGIIQEIKGVMGKLEKTLKRIQEKGGSEAIFEVLGIEPVRDENTNVEMVLEMETYKDEEEPRDAVMVGEIAKRRKGKKK